MESKIRTFDTGATRDQNATKHDPSGFMSPLVALRFCEYMTKHRVQPDGSIRAGDNWQKGIPLNAYAESEWRHHLDLWLHHRGYGVLAREPIEDVLCGILFNVQGYLHELIKRRLPTQEKYDAATSDS